MMFKDNLYEIKERIAVAAKKSGRKPEDITLVAVTKTISPERIKEAINSGITDFGENKVQELLSKYDEIKNNVNWHMIGHLQTNKVKNIVEKIKMIHSVDSIRLVEEIDKRAKKIGNKIDILIEINIGYEASKYGILPEKLNHILEQTVIYTNVCIKGLMCIAPYVENPEQNRKYFENMYNMYIDMKSNPRHNMDVRFLSMGMSGDYEIAIEEGANIVRIGSSLFGNRG